VAGAEDYGQSVINRQTAVYDFLICLIWHRMGTPTPRANSGTEEEFDRAIEAILNGKRVQILLFFSNLPVKPQNIDANQLLLVRAFHEKVSRLGVLYHTYDDHEQLRRLFNVSLREAYSLRYGDSKQSRYLPKIAPRTLDPHAQTTILIGNITLRERVVAPQWADSHIISLAEYRRHDIRLKWTMKTSSSYFRFGFKYYDSREAVFSAGSIQTVGQNILVHIGKNKENPTWFLTSYRAGYRLGPNIPLEDTNGLMVASFELVLSSSHNVALKLNGKKIYESFFVMDGIANLALMAWGDEYEFLCEIENLTLYIQI
jgi:hypothetical protein